MSTDQLDRLPARRPADPDRWLRRAWTAVVMVPVFFVIAFALGEGLYSLLGYKPENADAPVWALLVVDIPVLLVALIPCVAAGWFGRRANQTGDRRGIPPLVIGVVVGVGWLVLTIVSEVGNIVRT